jgi:hypothetical protein
MEFETLPANWTDKRQKFFKRLTIGYDFAAHQLFLKGVGAQAH